MKNRREFINAMAIGGVAAQTSLAAPQAASGKKIRMAVVGGGFGSSFHWHEHPQCVVTAVTDLYAVRRTKLRDAYRCDSVYDSLEDMLKKRNDLDAIAIFSDAPSHVKHVKMCMEHGLHVVSAVPACMSLEDAEQLRGIKEKTGRRYMMAESSYYRQPCIYARDLFQKGGFGQIFYTECEYYHDFNFDERLNSSQSLYYNPDGSNSWRQGLPPMRYPTHSLAFHIGERTSYAFLFATPVSRALEPGGATLRKHNSESPMNTPPNRKLFLLTLGVSIAFSASPWSGSKWLRPFPRAHLPSIRGSRVPWPRAYGRRWRACARRW